MQKPSQFVNDLNVRGALSRRNLLASAALLAVRKQARAQRYTPSVLAYVGAYTPNGLGIYLMSLNLNTGALTQLKVVSTVQSPSWIELSPNGKNLYAVNEISNFNGGTNGSVTSFAVDPSTGNLTQLNVVSSQGGGPAHLSVDPQGQFVYVANYGGGSIAVLPILSDGSLGNASDVHFDIGSVGPTQPTNAPPGSFAISGHDAPHAHMIHADPSGTYVFSTDLGQDRIYSWTINRTSGKLIPNSPPFYNVPPGDGPRHFVFSPNGQFLYSIQEEASTIIAWQYNGAGALNQVQMVSTLPPGFVGTNFTSEIRISADGNTVYGANRLHDSIAILNVNRDGTLSYVGETWTRGDYPRSFTIDPTGNYLVSCNQRSDALTTFRVGNNGQSLTFTGQYTPIGSPAIIIFLG